MSSYDDSWDNLAVLMSHRFVDEQEALADAEHKYVKFPKLHYLMSRPSPFQERFGK